jgi:hypothetical protein
MDLSAASRAQSASFQSGTPPHGVGWVLRWAAALAVLWFAGCVLAEFALCLAAERTLSRAARAGALEATLPRASFRSVGETVNRRLATRAAWVNQVTLSVQQNGTPIGGAIRAIDGDLVSVTIAMPVRAILPRWLSATSLRTVESQIVVRAERAVPGRELAGVGSRGHIGFTTRAPRTNEIVRKVD